jgi:hypothetical protein
MITGSSLILYSRLNLILANPKFLRLILVTILGNAVIFQLPDMIITYISGHSNTAVLHKIEDINPKFDIIFTFQEVLFSSLYIFVFVRFLNEGGTPVSQDMIRTFYFLIIAEIVIFMFNIILSILLYLHIYLARRMVLGLFYAIKLKVEFIVLNRFVAFAQGRQIYSGSNVDELQAGSTITDAPPSSELFKGSNIPISCRLDAFGNSSESAEAVLAATQLTGSRVQRAEMEEDILGIVMPSNAEERSQDYVGVGKLKRLEKLYLGRLGVSDAM